MTRGVLSGSLLLATLLLGRELLLAQQQTPPKELPEAPQPSISLPAQEEPAGNPDSSRRAEDTAIGRGQKGTNSPGFPPVSRPSPARMPVPTGIRPNIPGLHPECQPHSSSPAERLMSCQSDAPLFARFLNSATPLPLTARQKFILAARNVSDPFNLLTIAGVSAISIASDANTADGPGLRGFAKNAGVSLSQDTTGEFFGTFLIPSLAHQDPHYHRMPTASMKKRIAHCLYQVVWTQGDNGKGMLNYADLVGFALDDAIGSLYVPGQQTNFRADAERYGIVLATAPIDNIITEFVPDLARRIHVQVVVIQRIVNQFATTGPNQ